MTSLDDTFAARGDLRDDALAPDVLATRSAHDTLVAIWLGDDAWLAALGSTSARRGGAERLAMLHRRRDEALERGFDLAEVERFGR